MYTVSSLLACMGVFQYFNVTVSSLEARKKEFMVLESLGMTRKQLLRMLVLEGLYYSPLHRHLYSMQIFFHKAQGA